ncbi:MAG TPA: hypothetical protein VGL61_01080 [Kofleriaceae bacterium]|jgi:hypothetical protein
MKTIAFMLCLATSVAAAAPGSKAAIKADYDMVCNAPARSGALKKTDKSEQAQIIANYILGHLKTGEVREFLGTLGGMQPADKAPALKKAAKDAGYAGACPMADMT